MSTWEWLVKRDSLSWLAREFVQRLGLLKCSRSLSIPTNICLLLIFPHLKNVLMFPIFAFSYCREESEKLIMNTLTQRAVINIVNLCIFIFLPISCCLIYLLLRFFLISIPDPLLLFYSFVIIGNGHFWICMLTSIYIYRIYRFSQSYKRSFSLCIFNLP